MTTQMRTFAAAIAMLAALGCDTAVKDTPDATPGTPDATPISPVCLEATEHSDLAWVQQNVFTPNCALSGSCHVGTAVAAAGLNLEDGNSEVNLTNVPSKTVPAMDYVEPGAASDSYLMVVLGQIDGTLPEGGTMPFRSNLLCVQKRDAIERWINSL